MSSVETVFPQATHCAVRVLLSFAFSLGMRPPAGLVRRSEPIAVYKILPTGAKVTLHAEASGVAARGLAPGSRATTSKGRRRRAYSSASTTTVTWASTPTPR